ncbi:MAG: hypothetical protein H6510_17955 [Acidobacteria bacterium]|nr:hypothetical protein [Acidobacteriota bacterium]MCB9399702.1 hypothetical protein [Acidobacteriota bacterium]
MFCLIAFVLWGQGQAPIVGGPCEGCNLVFQGMPESLEPSVRIAPADEPGEPLILRGTVFDAQGKPAAGIIVYAYHTDAQGLYPKAETRHGRLRGWAKTDPNGVYEFKTIRPAAYPNSTIPQHIHMHIIEPHKATYYIDDVLFSDDPKLKGATPKRSPRGGLGVCMPQKVDGTWQVSRDIQLGLNIPGYP